MDKIKYIKLQKIDFLKNFLIFKLKIVNKFLHFRTKGNILYTMYNIKFNTI